VVKRCWRVKAENSKEEKKGKEGEGGKIKWKEMGKEKKGKGEEKKRERGKRNEKA